MAKKRKAKKTIIKRKRTVKKSKSKKWSAPELDVFGPVALDNSDEALAKMKE